MQSMHKFFTLQSSLMEKFLSNISDGGGKFYIPTFSEFNFNKEDWASYLFRMENHFKAYSVAADSQKRAYFLSWVGTDAIQLLQKLYGDLNLDSYSFEEITGRMSEYYKSSTHIIAARYKFLQTRMKTDQNYSSWVAELKGMARDCAFVCPNSGCNQNLVDSYIRDMVVLHTPHEMVRCQALQCLNPSLEDVLKIANTYQSTQLAKNIITCSSDPPVINQVFQESRKERSNSRGSRESIPNSIQSNPEKSKTYNLLLRKSCSNCFVNHDRKTCKFFKSRCNHCGRMGHIAPVCLSRNRSPNYANLVEEVFSDSEKVNLVNNIKHSGLHYYVDVDLNNHPTRMMLDSGATCSIIDKKTYQMLGSPYLHRSSSLLRSYGGANVPLKGWFTVNVRFQSTVKKLRLLVTGSDSGVNIFGTPWFHAFGMKITGPCEVNQILFSDVSSEVKSSVENLCKKYSEIFEAGLGTCSSFKATLYLKKDFRPKFFKPRPIPFAHYNSVKLEIERLLDAGIIKSVKTSQWAAPIVVVPKPNGKIRICGDFKVTVNPQLDIERYPIPRSEELFHKLQNGQYFSKIDLADAYLQIELDEEAKKMAVINTPFGLFQYQRLPFGIASAPAIFQCFMEQVIAGIPYCATFLDDMIVTGPTTEKHLEMLEKIFKSLKENGLRCNLSKCAFFQSKVEYLGNSLSAEGIKPSEKNIQAIQNLPKPKNLAELQSFIGKINYYNKFIPNFATICGPLNALRKKNSQFKWTDVEDKAYAILKKRIMDATQLAHYNSNYPISLATDASAYGVGAVLSIHYPNGYEYPLAFASKTLNDQEKKYSQIEKEALSIIFGVKKFHQYLSGRTFELITDHKPLVSLFHPEKGLPVYTLARLQRWAITLMGYTYTIRYRSTEKHSNADALSRLPHGPDPDFDHSEIETCNSIMEDQTFALEEFPINTELIKRSTREDPILRRVLDYVQKGWPNFVQDKDLKVYFEKRLSISCTSGILLLQTDFTRVIVPMRFRSSVLRMLHVGHWGIVRMKQMARRYCWWPGMDKEVEQLAKDCQTCQIIKPDPPRKFNSWPSPEKAWERIHVDFAGPFWNAMWLIVVDSYSKFPFIIKMTNITSDSTINALKQIFVLEGAPETIVSDNGAQFTSDQFQKFCSCYGITHLTTAPFHPASNGEAERFVRTFKEAMRKAALEKEGKDEALNTLLFSYRTTPSPRSGKSPSELLHGRQPRTLLSSLIPKNDQHRTRISKCKFQIDDQVYVKFFGGRDEWQAGSIGKHLGRMMYEVNTERGKVRRHQNQIRLRCYKTPETEHNKEGFTFLNLDNIPSQKSIADHDFESPNKEQIENPPASSVESRFEQADLPETVTLPDLRRSQRLRRPTVRFNL